MKGGANSSSRMSSLDYTRVNGGEEFVKRRVKVPCLFKCRYFLIPVPSSLSSPNGTSASTASGSAPIASSNGGGSVTPSNGVTKILYYFSNRSDTPFMSTIAGKGIGEITLRDFKVKNFFCLVYFLMLER